MEYEKYINRIEQMQKIQLQALELFKKKNADYGDAFAKYGTIGVLMRMEDKLQRFMSISNTKIQLVFHNDPLSLRGSISYEDARSGKMKAINIYQYVHAM